ncbi:MFS general substrate transporter [Aspergillus brunneoviolaceus CBS 621.78]|uniref:MFS general substrate transporter n=1 Tax=Aspergillus brunneoviolaceus CBS 621.78 TaxID=1450534 RepID=A0ACD1G7S1_9EURO|nr:MFS general substrate transporter [Aspergillus brunneoviolaceus CBS 621.78]RAH45315.1 MFS general substrate transporter [Aspergillus brunneoviolaceus CBS 621.78]
MSWRKACWSPRSETYRALIVSSFAAHSVTATTTILSSLLGGLMKLPYAKLLELWGRPPAFALSALCTTVGMVLMAACTTVEMYSAAQIFYMVGSSGITFSVTIFIADTAPLASRAWWIAFTSSPNILTVWAYGPAAQATLDTVGWRWGLGFFAIVVPVVAGPFAWLLFHSDPQQEDRGETTPRLAHYIREVDVVGLLLLCAGLALLLLGPGDWRAPLVVCFLVVGGLLVLAFGVYERHWAAVGVVPWRLLGHRNIVVTYAAVLAMFTALYVWESYFYSMLVVVWDLSVLAATYVTNVWAVSASLWALLVGLLLRRYGRVRPQAIYFGGSVIVLGVGLMIRFRRASASIAYVVLCQILVSLGFGTMALLFPVVLMATVASSSSSSSSPPPHLPAVLAVENMVSDLGRAIGSTISSAMWQAIFPGMLRRDLPANEAQSPLLDEIYEDLNVQTAYPVGSAVRDAINAAYSETYKLMLIVAVCLSALVWAFAWAWKEVALEDADMCRAQDSPQLDGEEEMKSPAL